MLMQIYNFNDCLEILSNVDIGVLFIPKFTKNPYTDKIKKLFPDVFIHECLTNEIIKT